METGIRIIDTLETIMRYIEQDSHEEIHYEEEKNDEEEIYKILLMIWKLSDDQTNRAVIIKKIDCFFCNFIIEKNQNIRDASLGIIINIISDPDAICYLLNHHLSKVKQIMTICKKTIHESNTLSYHVHLCSIFCRNACKNDFCTEYLAQRGIILTLSEKVICFSHESQFTDTFISICCSILQRNSCCLKVGINEIKIIHSLIQGAKMSKEWIRLSILVNDILQTTDHNL